MVERERPISEIKSQIHQHTKTIERVGVVSQNLGTRLGPTRFNLEEDSAGYPRDEAYFDKLLSISIIRQQVSAIQQKIEEKTLPFLQSKKTELETQLQSSLLAAEEKLKLLQDRFNQGFITENEFLGAKQLMDDLRANPKEEEKKSPKKTTTFETTQEFITEAIKEGAHLIKPSGLSEESWVRMRNIIGIYAGSPATLEQTAGVIPGIAKGIQELTEDSLTRERVRQLFKRGIMYLYENSSPSLQARIPKENLVFGKSRTLESRIKSSRAHGGTSYRLKEAIEKGASLQYLEDIAGGRNRLTATSKTLQGWGIDTSDLRTRLNLKSLEKLIQAENDDQKLQELFSKITLRFYDVYVEGENPLLTSIQGLLKEAGYHLTRQKGDYSRFMEIIKRSSIPMGILKIEVKSGPQKGERLYSFILTKHRQRALEALKAEPSLNPFLENPVKQICGPQAAIPTAWEVAKLKGLQNCTAILYKATGKHYRSVLGYKGKFSDLLDQDCPVPIFRMKGVYHCYISQEEALIEYFRDKFVK